MRLYCRELIFPAALPLLLSALSAPAARQIVDCDLCIYGATSGGVAAAAQATRHGLKVALLDPARHIGGMSSGGLGATDKGNVDSIGGLSSEFYLRVSRKYTPATNTRVWMFEPKVASAVFADLLAESGVVPLLDEPLAVVRKNGARIVELETTTGLIVRAGMYLDTTYEGDLLAAAGVSFRVGREANNLYNETKNGVLTPSTSIFTSMSLDPYVVPGNPASGLIEGITPGPVAAPGTGDALVQAYNFRLCLTKASNRIPIAPPPDYRAADYEMIGRYLIAKAAAGQVVDLGSFTNGIFHNIHQPDGFPGGKSDWNSNKGMASDWVGYSHEWPTATPARRAEIAKAHENYIRGIFQFLRTDPRVPAVIRNEVDLWGLPVDEYVSNQNWSPQLYVREARRMIGDYVLTEANGRSTVTAPNSIALGSYALDSHYCQRVVVGGKIAAEGGFFELPPKPWPIGFGAITPKATECTNLMSTFALSATHVAFSSARMEPVFMMTSHSAATAAAVALQREQHIQQVSYPELATLLRSDGQVLDWASTTTSNGIVVEAEGPGGVPQPTGTWVAGSNPGFSGTGYVYANTGTPVKFCTFAPTLPLAGSYKVMMSWVQSSNRATNANVIVNHAGGTATLAVNQRLDPDNGGAVGGWYEMGTWNFDAGSGPVVRLDNTNADGLVIADAVRFEPTGSLALPTNVSLAAHDAVTLEGSLNPARLVFRREGLLTNALTVSLATSGTATPGTDCAALPATITFAAGSAQATLTLQASSDTLLEDTENLTVQLMPAAGYNLSAAASATIRMEDSHYDRWRLTAFAGAPELDPQLTTPTADPDNDGLNNYSESVFGTPPLSGSNGPAPAVAVVGGQVELTFPKLPSAGGVPIVIQSSSSLSGWSTAIGARCVRTTESADGSQRWETWSVPQTGSLRFYRLSL